MIDYQEENLPALHSGQSSTSKIPAIHYPVQIAFLKPDSQRVISSVIVLLLRSPKPAVIK